jgi:hypothetical protein
MIYSFINIREHIFDPKMIVDFILFNLITHDLFFLSKKLITYLF